MHVLAAAFFLVALFFIHRSFYGMRIPARTNDDEIGAEDSEDDSEDSENSEPMEARS